MEAPPRERAGGLRKPLALLGAALGLGWLADVLFYDEWLGVSVPLFAAVFTGALYGICRAEGRRPAARNLWIPAALLFFTAMTAVRTGPLVTFLNVVLALLLTGHTVHFFAAGDAARASLRTFVVAPFAAAGGALVEPARLAGREMDLRSVGSRGRRNLLPVARGLLLALPILVLFGFLLASADLIFERIVKDLLNFRIPPLLIDLGFQAILVGAVGWIAAGLLAYAAGLTETEGTALGRPARPLFRIGAVEANTVLASVGFLFFVFVWIQLTYLFGGVGELEAEGYTYAEYARRGFLDLLAVSVMTLALLLVLERTARIESDRQRVVFRVLGSVLVALVLVILASAFERLRLYENAYGYTRLRLYALVLMPWLGAAMLWLLVTRWTRRVRFGPGAFVAALGLAATLNLLSPDAFIARRNLERYAATGKLDARYLTWLSADAAPVLARALPRLEGRDRQIVAADLRDQLAHLERVAASTGWPSYHLGRRRALRSLREALSQPEHEPGVGD